MSNITLNLKDKALQNIKCQIKIIKTAIIFQELLVPIRDNQIQIVIKITYLVIKKIVLIKNQISKNHNRKRMNLKVIINLKTQDMKGLKVGKFQLHCREQIN